MHNRVWKSVLEKCSQSPEKQQIISDMLLLLITKQQRAVCSKSILNLNKINNFTHTHTHTHTIIIQQIDYFIGIEINHYRSITQNIFVFLSVLYKKPSTFLGFFFHILIDQTLLQYTLCRYSIYILEYRFFFLSFT